MKPTINPELKQLINSTEWRIRHFIQEEIHKLEVKTKELGYAFTSVKVNSVVLHYPGGTQLFVKTVDIGKKPA